MELGGLRYTKSADEPMKEVMFVDGTGNHVLGIIAQDACLEEGAHVHVYYGQVKPGQQGQAGALCYYDDAYIMTVPSDEAKPKMAWQVDL